MSIPYNIKTDAGKALYEKMNLEQGSIIWGAVGKGIEAIEAEIEQRIIKLLESKYPIRYPRSITAGGGEGELIGELIAFIKGEK